MACLEQSLLEHPASQIHLEVPQPQALVLPVCLDQLRTHHLLASLSNQPHLALALARQHLQGQALVSRQEEGVMNLCCLYGIRLNRAVFFCYVRWFADSMGSDAKLSLLIADRGSMLQCSSFLKKVLWTIVLFQQVVFQ